MRLPLNRPSFVAQKTLRIVLLSAALAGIASPAFAQIISPIGLRAGISFGGDRVAPVHAMVGYAAWDYGTDFYDGIVVDSHEGTIEGAARSGAIVAADVPIHLSDNVSMTFGGWFNNGGTRTVHDPEHLYRAEIGGTVVIVPDRVITQSSRFSSAYVGLFYRFVGVQGGIVPVQIKQTLTADSGTPQVSNRNQMDLDVFGVIRYSETETFLPMTLTFGIGAYRYSARGPNILENGFFDEGSASPASTRLSGFVNFSIAFTDHIAFDFSGWGTGANNKRLNDSQNRATVGLGITF